MPARWLAAALVAAMALAGCSFLEEPAPPPIVAGQAQAHVAEEGEARGRPAEVPAEARGLMVTLASTGRRGAEPTIGVTPAGTILVAAYEEVLRSTDGVAWEEVHTVGVGQSFDPMLWVDPVTGRAIDLHINPQRTCQAIAVSDDEGDTWDERPLLCPGAVVDHQKVATGPAAGRLAPLATAANGGRLTSLCYNSLGATQCAMSHDGGLTFGPAIPIEGAGTGVPVVGGAVGGVTGNCGGLNGHQHHAHDGAIYVPYGYQCRESRIAVSTDGGTTWVRSNPVGDQLELDPEVASTPDGTVYFLYRSPDQLLHLVRSKDRFATVEGPFTVTPPGVKGTVFAGLQAGDDGRIAVAYLGTEDSAAGPDDVPPSTSWHLFLGVSLDADAAAPTFTTIQVTPDADPIQRGSICHSKECADGNRNLLDFMDLSLGPDGRAWAAVADGCTSSTCRTPGQLNPETSRDDRLVVAHVSAGPSLFADESPLRPL